jgi:hypothetical protein
MCTLFRLSVVDITKLAESVQFFFQNCPRSKNFYQPLVIGVIEFVQSSAL